jgi:hypothetical protein
MATATKLAPKRKRRATVAVALIAPPQIPRALVEDLAEDLPDVLAERVSGSVTWKVPVIRDTIVPDAEGGPKEAELDPDTKGREDAVKAIRKRMKEEGWDLAVGITDLPIRSGRHPLVADTVGDVALISAPALGPVRLRRRVREVIVALAEWVLEEEGPRVGAKRRRRVRAVGRTVRAEDDRLQVVLPMLLGHARVIVGMIRQNRPWRIVPKLSLMITAALATAAFALVNSDVWQLSDALPAPRLLLLTVISVLTMVAWLIVIHDLWETPSDEGGREQAALFNAVSAISLTLGVLCLYATLFVLLLASSLLLVHSSVLEQNLMHPVGIGAYLSLTWFSASLATVGGALGSGLESDIDIREAAYGYHRERRKEDDRKPKVKLEDNPAA